MRDQCFATVEPWSEAELLQLRSRDDVLPVHEGAESLRDDYGSVSLLIILENRDQRAADRESGSVQRVDELSLPRALRAVLDAGAARLEGFRVAAGGNLAVGVLPRQPDLEVVGLRGGKADVAAAQKHAAVRKLELRQHRLGVAGESLELVVRLLRRGEGHQLHLVELMLPYQAAHVGAIGPGFAAETRRIRGVADR